MPDRLLEGETLISRRHRHWILLVQAMWIPVALVLIVVVGLDIGLRDRVVNHDVKLALTLAVLAVAGAWAIVVWMQWSATAFTLTDQRVILDRGVFSRSSKVIALDRVQDVSTSQGLIARLLGYGRGEIDAAGAGGAEVLDHVPSPNEFRDQVFVHSEKLRRTSPPT